MSEQGLIPSSRVPIEIVHKANPELHCVDLNPALIKAMQMPLRRVEFSQRHLYYQQLHDHGSLQ